MVKLLTNIKFEIQKIEVIPPRLNFLSKGLAWLSMANIIVAKANKGDAVVVLDTEHHYGLSAKHLADSRTYELLETDPSAEIVLRYHEYLKRRVDDKILDDYQYHCLKACLH